MRLLLDWKNIVKRAWSFRFVVAAAVLSACEVILPLFVDLFPRGIFAALCFVAVVAAAVARVVAQKNMPNPPKGI